MMLHLVWWRRAVWFVETGAVFALTSILYRTVSECIIETLTTIRCLLSVTTSQPIKPPYLVVQWNPNLFYYHWNIYVYVGVCRKLSYIIGNSLWTMCGFSIRSFMLETTKFYLYATAYTRQEIERKIETRIHLPKKLVAFYQFNYCNCTVLNGLCKWWDWSDTKLEKKRVNTSTCT